MKQKLLTLFTLLLTVCSGAWAQYFSATPLQTLTADVKYSENTLLTSSVATITGGKMTFIAGGSSSVECIRKQSSKYAFECKNNAQGFKIELNQELAAGDIISASILTNGAGSDNDRGIWVTTATTRPGSAPSCVLTGHSDTGKEYVNDTYTVVEEDGLCGESTIYVWRKTGNATYFIDFAITAGATQYTVTLNKNGGTTEGVAKVAEGDTKLTINTEPEYAGYMVEGYYTAATAGTKVAAADGTLVASVTGFTDGDGKWTPTEDKTLYTYWEPAKYTLTVAPNQAGWGTVSPTSVENIPNGTATSNSDNTFSVNGTTVTATAADATAEYTYAFVEWTDLPATVTENATVKATFSRTANSYTLAWNTNGGSELEGDYTSGNTAYGTTLTAPTDPTRDGYIFDGWNTANDGSGNDYAGTMPAANTTYYAQWETTPNVYYYKDATHYDNGTFKNPEGGDAGSSDNKNLSTPWTIVNGSTITGVTSVVANGCQYDGKNNHINAYIKVPTDGDKDTKNVTFTIASGYTATISMKIGGYSANPTVTLKPLEDNTLGDAVAYTGTVGGVATTENDFNKISWDVESGTYVLNVTSKNAYISQINIETEAIPTVPVTISAYGLATYASDNALNFDGVEGIKAYRATISANTITFTQVTEVPAGEGVLLKATTGEGVRNFDIPVTTTDVWAADYNDFVRGTDVPVATTDGTNYNYILSTKDGVLGFYNANGTVVARNRAYLTTTEAPSTKGMTMIFADEEETTGIRSIENRELRSENYDYYNLSGQRVGKDYKGIVIVNGKKMLNK